MSNIFCLYKRKIFRLINVFSYFTVLQTRVNLFIYLFILYSSIYLYRLLVLSVIKTEVSAILNLYMCIRLDYIFNILANRLLLLIWNIFEINYNNKYVKLDIFLIDLTDQIKSQMDPFELLPVKYNVSSIIFWINLNHFIAIFQLIY